MFDIPSKLLDKIKNVLMAQVPTCSTGGQLVTYGCWPGCSGCAGCTSCAGCNGPKA